MQNRLCVPAGGHEADRPPSDGLQPQIVIDAKGTLHLIYFNGESHVGIYVGGGFIIDAPVPGASVEKVSLSQSWYAQTVNGAARP